MTDRGVVEFRDEPAQVQLSYAPWDEDIGSLVVHMRAKGLVYELDVESSRGDGLDAFFAGLVDQWQGWSGVRHWQTILGELAIDATHRGRTVELLFIARIPYRGGEPGDPDVEVRLRIEVAPGEALSQLAAASSRLVAST